MRKLKKAGYSIVEILISTSLSVVISLIAVQVYGFTQKIIMIEQDKLEEIQKKELVYRFIKSDLVRAKGVKIYYPAEKIIAEKGNQKLSRKVYEQNIKPGTLILLIDNDVAYYLAKNQQNKYSLFRDDFNCPAVGIANDFIDFYERENDLILISSKKQKQAIKCKKF